MRDLDLGGGLTLGALRALARRLLLLPRWFACLLVLGWMSLIWQLSSVSMTPPSRSWAWAFLTNLCHAPLFGLLALWCLLAIVPRPVAPAWPQLSWREGCWALLWTLGYGVVDEVHQSSTLGRLSSAQDVLTDVVGGLCVFWAARYLLDPLAREVGLRWRLLGGVGLCCGAAWLATVI